MSAYVPILATDPSRLEGLAATPDVVKHRLTPLLEITPPPRNGSRHAAPHVASLPLPHHAVSHAPLEAHLDGIVGAIADAFGARPAFVDACDAGSERGDDCARTTGGRIHLAYLLDEARVHGLTLIPVTGLRRPDAYQLAVADAASVDRRGVALRLQRPDFRDPDALDVRVLAVLDALEAASSDADLVIDFGGVTSGHLAAHTATARRVLTVLTRDLAWRSVTIAAATQLLADGRGPTRGPRAVPRTDWLLWRSLTTGVGAVPALDQYARAGALRFGDYGPLLYGPHPVRPGSAAEWVGYAHGAEWLVRDVVGEGARGAGASGGVAGADVSRPDGPRADAPWNDAPRRRSMRVVRESAVARVDATDAAPWPDDRRNDMRADPLDPSTDPRRGAAERATWRAAAVTHHLTVAVEQLAPSSRVVRW